MLIQDTIFYSQEWRWNNFIKYLVSTLIEYNCIEQKIPSEYSYKESSYGSKTVRAFLDLWELIEENRASSLYHG